ncbi:hypothetical protein [Ktedonospora formicarum]|uniref:Uncharacterized protein n=1 Tax=Ktedonospora formicarum TaxID=2778364 RepID=A0A8J3IBH0_9CHLR|nr:hypothetical protein [Ktedonospora formicarum]GHO48294.1 hypothetical protein KSX_64570 [Ktedonospora formicarum]
MCGCGESLLCRAALADRLPPDDRNDQGAEQVRTDVHILDVIRLAYGIALVNERASDSDGANRMLDLVRHRWNQNKAESGLKDVMSPLGEEPILLTTVCAC